MFYHVVWDTRILKRTKKKTLLKLPDFYSIIASTSDESPLAAWPGICANQATSRGCRSPAHSIDTHAMCMEDLMGPAVVAELKYAHLSI
jgi:hypothetical protein